MIKTALIDQLKDALDRLYDPVSLRDHPLAQTLGLACAAPQSRAESLRRLLWEAVEALRPADALPPGRAEWSVYHVLRLRYLHAMQATEVQEELSLSPATYYRRKSEGLEAMARLLAEGIVEEPSEDTAEAAPPAFPARDEALRVARESEREVLPLPQVLAECEPTLRRLAQARGIALRLDAPAALPAVYISPAMLHLIVVQGMTEAAARAEGRALTLAVRADGEEALWRISPLREGAAPGAEEGGEGPAVCRSLLEFYGGQLDMGRDDHGRPALLWRLPVARPRNILVVEDSAETIELYRRYLAGRPYRVHAASSAAEIEARLGEATPDAILLDVFMPGLDGWTVLEGLKMAERTARVPVVVCSILGRTSAAAALGAAAVLAKPVSRQDLLGVLDRLAAGNRGGTPPAPRE